MPVDMLEKEQAPEATEIQSHLDNPSDEVLELMKESDEDTRSSGAPTTEGGALWTAKQEAPIEQVREPEKPMEPAVEDVVPKNQPEIITDSIYRAQPKVEYKISGIPARIQVEKAQAQKDPTSHADVELAAVGSEPVTEASQKDPFDVELDFPKAETMADEYAKNPNRGIHHEMDPAFKEELTTGIEQGIEKAEKNLPQRTLETFQAHLEEIDDRIVQEEKVLEDSKIKSEQAISEQKEKKRVATEEAEVAESEIIRLQNEQSEELGARQATIDQLKSARAVIQEAQEKIERLNL